MNPTTQTTLTDAAETFANAIRPQNVNAWRTETRALAETIVAYWERETTLHFASIGLDECGCCDCQGRRPQYDYWRLKGAKAWLAAHPALIDIVNVCPAQRGVNTGAETNGSDALTNRTPQTERAEVTI